MGKTPSIIHPTSISNIYKLESNELNTVCCRFAVVAFASFGAVNSLWCS